MAPSSEKVENHCVKHCWDSTIIGLPGTTWSELGPAHYRAWFLFGVCVKLRLEVHQLSIRENYTTRSLPHVHPGARHSKRICLRVVQVKLTPQYLELKRIESLSQTTKVYYGPNIPQMMFDSYSGSKLASSPQKDADGDFKVPGVFSFHHLCDC